jgi:cellulose synthase/poly-beta-1,6-N-acetylglucosamine synthase-like glycosyltransferase
VIVLDNASTDGSAAIAEEFAERDQRFRGIRSATNLGFAGGNNAAAREARGDYLVLLNADTIVTAGWVHRLLRPFLVAPGDSGPIGVTTPVTNFSGNETRVLTDYRNISEMDEFAAALAAAKRGELLELRMAALLCAAVPAALWREAGGLDERFGVGMFEDDDFSLRIKRAGYRVVSVEDCFIHHFGNGSFAALPSEKAQRLFEENRKYFEEKWQIEWQPHTPRPGVPPLGPEDRKPVGAFLQPRRRSASSSHQPRILALHPASARAGTRFQVQPDGNSALVAECENATPATSVQFGDQLLATSYGNSRLVSAIVPNELLLRPGRTPVRLVNDFGASEPAEFVISE